MKIIIKETDIEQTLALVDPRSGVDYVRDFIGNHGALADGQFAYDEDRDGYLCSQETYDWWHGVLSAEQELEDRVHALRVRYGTDAVEAALSKAGNVDLEDYAGVANAALDETFATGTPAGLTTFPELVTWINNRCGVQDVREEVVRAWYMERGGRYEDITEEDLQVFLEDAYEDPANFVDAAPAPVPR